MLLWLIGCQWMSQRESDVITKYYVRMGVSIGIMEVEFTMTDGDVYWQGGFDTWEEARDEAERIAKDRLEAAKRLVGRAQNEVEAAYADLERVKRMVK